MKITGILGMVLLLAVSCNKDPKHPGYEFTGNVDMYRSPSYETYSSNPNFPDSMSARLPVAGTIPRGYMPYPYPNTNEGYETAGKELVNPLAKNDINQAEGKRLFEIYCVHCHGVEGKGDGTMVKNDKFPPPPSFTAQLKNLPEGKMFHSLQYGKGLMGSHAAQLSKEERWKIIMHLQILQNQESLPVDSFSNTAAADTSAKKN